LLKLKQKHPQLKTLVSVGGWTLSGQFSDVALSDESRVKFARSCVAFMKKYGFDGVDIDWEFPGGGGLAGNKSRKEDYANFTLLLAEMRRQFDAAGKSGEKNDARHYLLTIAAPAGPEKIAALQVAKMAASLDWFNVMCYDFHGGWDKTANFNAPLYDVRGGPAGTYARKLNADWAMKAYLAAGAPSEKLVLGVPFYGRGWKGVPAVNDGLFQTAAGEAGVFDYHLIASKYLGKYPRHWNDEAKVPWLYDPTSRTMISYDDPQSLKLKAAYVREQKLGGVMIWELGGDDAKGSLMRAIGDGLKEN
jgi:chitinase